MVGRTRATFIAASIAVFLLGNTVAVIIPHVAPRDASRQLIVTQTLERELVIPVDGVSARSLVDTWGAARHEGRKHEGIDIMAPAGTPVRATAAGRIAKLFQSVRGGTTIYEFDQSGRFIFYYAHLQAYALGVHVGQVVEQGQLIAYVGATGNTTTPHLHFEIQRAVAPAQWWRGVAVNPYVPLKTARLPASETPAVAQ